MPLSPWQKTARRLANKLLWVSSPDDIVSGFPCNSLMNSDLPPNIDSGLVLGSLPQPGTVPSL